MPPDIGHSTKRLRKRAGRCYEIAGRVFLFEDGLDHCRLVHGLCRIDTIIIGHAWIASIDRRHIWDPTLNAIATGDYVIEREYRRSDAEQMFLLFKHWGPWHDTAGVTRPDRRVIQRAPQHQKNCHRNCHRTGGIK
jgi:hypothetical protein